MQDNLIDLMTVRELATRLRVKPSWIYSHADALGGFRLGKYLRFSPSRVMESLERGMVNSSGLGFERPLAPELRDEDISNSGSG